MWLAILAHELRNPLATVVYARDIIAGGHELDRAARRARDIAERQVRRAVRLVNDLCDVCAGSRQNLALRKEIVELAEIVARATETASYMLAARRHGLTVSLTPAPVFLHADAQRLEQVLTNLLANATKFTEPGGDIRLTADSDAGQVVLCIRDNGRGICSASLPWVFDLFCQAMNSGVEAGGGLGIGLALVKSLVESHGGSVAAFSEGPGTGSEFVVRLPAHTGGSL
jgi:signal transduction histidine kinase